MNELYLVRAPLSVIGFESSGLSNYKLLMQDSGDSDYYGIPLVASSCLPPHWHPLADLSIPEEERGLSTARSLTITPGWKCILYTDSLPTEVL